MAICIGHGNEVIHRVIRVTHLPAQGIRDVRKVVEGIVGVMGRAPHGIGRADPVSDAIIAGGRAVA